MFSYLYFLILLSSFYQWRHARAQYDCPLAKYSDSTYELMMVSHQARALISIDNNFCGFGVSALDVVGFEGLSWWAADELSIDAMINGAPLFADSSLDHDLINATQQVEMPRSSWSKAQSTTVIALWIPSEARLVGYVQLDSNTSSPTMFQHCVKYAEKAQIRWNINLDEQQPELNSADFSFEGHLSKGQYQSIGFPLAMDNIMGGADSITYGFVNDTPFALDFFFPTYGECRESSPGKFGGVCTDLQLGGGREMYDNVNMSYWQYLEGTWLITASRLLNSTDRRFDLDINPFTPMQLLWAAASFQTNQNQVPMLGYHGTTFGTVNVTLLEGADNEKDTQCELIYDPLAISTGSSHLIEAVDSDILYASLGPKTSQNPLQYEDVIYIQGKPTPTIQATKGQNLVIHMDSTISSIIITDSPVGGQHVSQHQIYAQGTGQVSWLVGEGVQEDVHSVYYQSVDNPLMGGKILLSDGENGGPILDFKAVWSSLEVEWSLEGEGDETMMTWSVEATKPAGWISIGFGSMMNGGYAYVAWLDEQSGQGLIRGYHMSGQTAGSTHYNEDAQILNGVVEKDGVTGRLKMSFQRLFVTPSQHEPNIDGNGEVDMIWAYGQTWSSQTLSSANIHSARGVEIVNLLSGESRDKPVAKMWLVHGILMFVGWSFLVPLAVMVARYFKVQLGPTWMVVHKYINITGLLASLAAFAVAVYEMQVVGAVHFTTVHTKLGLAVTVVGVYQGVQGFIRPAKPGPDSTKREHIKRGIWGIPHKFVGFSLLVLSQAAVITGLEAVELKGGSGDTMQLQIAVYAWIGFVFVVALMLQCKQMVVVTTEKSASNAPNKNAHANKEGSSENSSVVDISSTPPTPRPIPNIEDVEAGAAN
eukprot:TRINITY_DN2764_c0_g1_i12.p1 TRINITY_DN2764_c0_g1~~TRINITY_DN2764_c0_g1_i12.p1  ORF type:complete len:875 (-),score=184.75 TRINITY_DN2764_c0_g1_i12:896-3520(-)